MKILSTKKIIKKINIINLPIDLLQNIGISQTDYCLI
jgi:hypothetical protein